MKKWANLVVAAALTAIVVSCMFFCTKAYADKYENHYDVPDIYYVTEEVTNQYTTEEYTTVEEHSTHVTNQVADSTALSLSAAALQFDFATDHWQYSGGLGNYEDSTAGSIGVAKRLGGKSGLLLNGSYNQGFDSGKPGYNFGISGRFR